MGFRPEKLILDPSRPPKSRHLGPFYTQNGQKWDSKRPKKTRFFEKKFLLQMIFFRFLDGLGPSKKTEIGPLDPPVDPILAQFVGKKADFGVKKHVFSREKNLLQIIFYRFPDGLGPSKT